MSHDAQIFRIVRGVNSLKTFSVDQYYRSTVAFSKVADYTKDAVDAAKYLAQGLAVTFDHMRRRPITVQYPYEKLIPSERYRGRIHYEFDKCIACEVCVRVCPINLPVVDWVMNKDTKKKVKSTSQVTKYILVFKVKERGVKTQKKMIHHINKALKKIPTQKGSSVKIDERFAIDSAGSIYKGIWRVENTSSPMAGSFVLKEYNQKKQKVFSVGLVYAPSEKKRSFIMRFEALL